MRELITEEVRRQVSIGTEAVFRSANIHIHLQVTDPAVMDEQLRLSTTTTEVLYQKVETVVLKAIIENLSTETPARASADPG